jgi:hypothetical protein
MSSDTPFTRENLDYYLKELAKEFRRLGGKKMPAEIILIGGASILVNYGFRDMTYDMDAIISASSAIKDAINHVGDRYELPNGWLNTDFVRTKSYTPKLIEFSVYYKTFYGVLTVRTVTAEYLIAMKIKSGRRYKNDLSDIVGIISEHNAKGKPLTYMQIDKAVCDLYGSWDGIVPELRQFVVSVLEQPEDSALYAQYRESETQSKDILLEFEREYPNVANEDNINAILEKAKRKKQSKNEPER